jgi:ABC-type Fe3+ transport system permease subunit
MKELPATLLLRPFNFDTLATQVFTLVSLSLAWHHRGKPSGSLDEPFCRS